MNDYIEVRIDASPCDETTTDILASLLCDEGYESFVPDDKGVTAYIRSELFDLNALHTLIGTYPVSGHTFNVTTEEIEGRDWNSEWEKNYFQPIAVDNRCVIHSSFHHDFPKCEYDIVIDPKMAFGTGHHATTSLIIRQLLDTDLSGKCVIDIGTGTGILAILAAMSGASKVDAVEIDPFAYENAVENVRINHHPEINVILSDATALRSIPPVDLVLANINRNIIIRDMGSYAAVMKPGATILLSGFYTDDVPVLLNEARKHYLEFIHLFERDRWACLELKKC